MCVDSNNFIDLGKIERKTNIRVTKRIREEYSLDFNPIKTRFLKIHAKNVGICPDWHQGSGRPAWVFADEIVIK